MAKPAPKSDPTARLSKQLDKELASSAYRKVMAGQRPTAKEAAALRRVESEQEETRRWQYYDAIPQKHWRAMSGRQTKVLHEQAERYGIDFGGRSICLPKVVRQLHDFLAKNARKLADEDDPLLNSDVASPALERYREERAAMARLDRLEREGQLVARGDVREGLGRVAAILRDAGDGLLQQFGRGAVELLNEALCDAEQEIKRLFETEQAVHITSEEPAA
ncbi:hypothetical protein AYO47_00175 [Planctomyces sp. SCGC AG-212-M04]|nr:hypothetical protein AYO47_00175 [Planctomyces sp. SCGC AG-212-M04]